MAKSVTGIAIGNDNLCMAVCDNGTVQKVVIEPLPEGLKADGRLVSIDAAADFIKQVAREFGGVSKRAALVLSGAESLTRCLNLPAMTERELSLNLPYEFRDYISQGKDRYYYDYALLRMQTDADGTPETMDIMASAVSKQVIEDYAAMMRRAGMKLVAALPTSAALQNVVSGNPAATHCCIIDFAYQTTNLHFFKDGMYDIGRVVETGAIDIDRAIAGSYNVDDHVAQTYRLTNYEDSLRCQAAADVYERIAVEVQRALNFYEFNNPDVAVEHVYFCGSGQGNEAMVAAVEGYVDRTFESISGLIDAHGELASLAVECPAAVGATIGVR